MKKKFQNRCMTEKESCCFSYNLFYVCICATVF